MQMQQCERSFGVCKITFGLMDVTLHTVLRESGEYLDSHSLNKGASDRPK